MNSLKLKNIIQTALDEDIGFVDLSSQIFDKKDHSTGTFTARAGGILAGGMIIPEVYRLLDSDIEIELLINDGDAVHPGDHIANVRGAVSSLLLLGGERVILNLVQHMSGIATATRKAVDALGDSHTRVCDTRKTLPGLRMIQKYAVRCGGGYNHRFRLDDGVIIKDNHIKASGGITGAVQQFRDSNGPTVRIEVETETREQVLEAVEAGVDIIMFDNRSPEEVRELVTLVPETTITEISGGITPETIGKYRDTGVDYISMGYLTHSVTALDISFNLEEPGTG